MLCHRRRHASRKGQEMSDYTPEPWRVDARTGCYAIYQASENHNCLSGMDKQAIVYQSGRGEESQPNGYRYLTEEQLANARRIVACVNACAGIADPAAEIARLRADNDEIDEVCTKRQLEIYKLEAEIAKLRAEREELREALGLLVGAKDWTFHCVCEASDEEHLRTQVDYTERLWQRARAALAEKGE